MSAECGDSCACSGAVVRKACSYPKPAVLMDNTLASRLSAPPRPEPVMRKRHGTDDYESHAYGEWWGLSEEDLCAGQRAVQMKTYRFAGLQDFNDRIACLPANQKRVENAENFRTPDGGMSLIPGIRPDLAACPSYPPCLDGSCEGCLQSNETFYPTNELVFAGRCNPYRASIKNGVFYPSALGSAGWRDDDPTPGSAEEGQSEYGIAAVLRAFLRPEGEVKRNR